MYVRMMTGECWIVDGRKSGRWKNVEEKEDLIEVEGASGSVLRMYESPIQNGMLSFDVSEGKRVGSEVLTTCQIRPSRRSSERTSALSDKPRAVDSSLLVARTLLR